MVISEKNLEEFLQGNDLAVLKFTAVWCGPCKAMKPILSAVQTEVPGLVVGEIDVDASPNLAVRYGIQTIPQFRLFKAGKEIGRLSNAAGKEKFKAWIQACVQNATAA